MFHWKFFCLIICVCLLIQYCENANKGSVKTKFAIFRQEALKKHKETTSISYSQIKFPLWIEIHDSRHIGRRPVSIDRDNVTFTYKLPFIIQINEENVLYNRSAKQGRNLQFPLWTEVKATGGDNGTGVQMAKLKFPFLLEVVSMHIANTGTMPVLRTTYLQRVITGLGTITGAVIIAHVIKDSIRFTKEFLDEITMNNYTSIFDMPRPKSFLGEAVNLIVGNLIQIVPFISEQLKAKFVHILQAAGDGLVLFLVEQIEDHVLGLPQQVSYVVMSILGLIPFFPTITTENRSLENISNEGKKATNEGKKATNEDKIAPQVYFPNVTSQEPSRTVIIINPGQQNVPGYFEFLIEWPGSPLAQHGNLIILHPPQTELPGHPDALLVWPGQSPISERPNMILILPDQKTIPGYPDCIISWDGTSPTEGKTIIHQGTQEIPNVSGIKLIWPGEKGFRKKKYINILPNQIQVQNFPTIVIEWEPSTSPTVPPGIAVIHPGTKSVLGHPSIIFVWPGSSLPPGTSMIIKMFLGERQVPLYPNLIILNPNETQTATEPEREYVKIGQTAVPNYPEITLYWPPVTTTMKSTVIYVPPGATTVPGFPKIKINRPSKQWPVDEQVIRRGDKTIQEYEFIFLVWLELPTDLISPSLYPKTDTLLQLPSPQYPPNVPPQSESATISESTSPLEHLPEPPLEHEARSGPK